MLCSGNESSPSPSTGEESSKISNSLPTHAFLAFRRRTAVARIEAADWSLASPDRRPGLPFSPRSSSPGPSFISCTSNIEHLRWDRGAGWCGCQKTVAVGMRVRWHPQPPQLRLWSVIWFLTARPVSNRLSSGLTYRGARGSVGNQV